MKLINLLMLKIHSKKKSLGDKFFSLYLRTIAIILILAIFIIVITNQYHMEFNDTLIVTIILFAIVFVATSVVDSHIIKKYFEPLQNLLNTANSINDSRTLSKRINTNKDAELEIIRFTKTFNRMCDRLENAFQHEKQFSRNISHEIKTPLAVIMSNCEYAQDFIDDPQEIKDTLDTISFQANRILSITSQLSDLAKMDDNNKKLDYEIFCIDELVKITLDEVLIEYEHLNKNISVNLHGDSNINVRADRIMMVRLFINLISNSIKYGKQNGSTDIYLYKKGTSLEVHISDNGIGISEDDLSNVWEPFFRVNHSNPDSTGLGLPMVKKIVSIHGGHIDINSELNKGTDFYFTMPIIQD